MNTLSIAIINDALAKMASQGYFSICTIRDILQVTKTVPDGDLMRQLELLHCVHYKDMSKEVLAALPEMISKALSGPVFMLKVVAYEQIAIAPTDVVAVMPNAFKPAIAAPKEEKKARNFLGFSKS